MKGGQLCGARYLLILFGLDDGWPREAWACFLLSASAMRASFFFPERTYTPKHLVVFLDLDLGWVVDRVEYQGV